MACPYLRTWLPMYPPTAAPPTVPTLLPPVRIEPATAPTPAPVIVFRSRVDRLAQPLLKTTATMAQPANTDLEMDFMTVSCPAKMMGCGPRWPLACAKCVHRSCVYRHHRQAKSLVRTEFVSGGVYRALQTYADTNGAAGLHPLTNGKMLKHATSGGQTHCY